jgi:hypothetical protein
MAGDEFLAKEVLRHGAYVCLRAKDMGDTEALARAPVPALAERLGLRNEFAPEGGPPPESVAYLRRQGATPRDVEDNGVLRADWVIHAVSVASDPVMSFCVGMRGLLEPYASVRILSGVVRPRNYTGAAMEKWAYARAVAQKPGSAMPNAFLLPMSKAPDWWGKGWMERHTYFLPRYDEAGRMVAEGHALAAADGIPRIYRRTYHALDQPASDDAYDFITYFECADPDIPLFERICANLRDVGKNPEWKFVREGPSWHGRRVPTWQDLFAA